MPLSTEFATFRSMSGSPEIIPLLTLITVPLSFSNMRKSSGPRKAIAVGKSSPFAICSTLRLESKTRGSLTLELNGLSLNFRP